MIVKNEVVDSPLITCTFRAITISDIKYETNQSNEKFAEVVMSRKKTGNSRKLLRTLKLD